MVPELYGNPKSFTKNTSRLPKRESVEGNKSLKINKRIATETILANTKLLNLGLGLFLK